MTKDAIKNINIIMFLVITITLFTFGLLEHIFDIKICALCYIQRLNLVLLQFLFILLSVSYNKGKYKAYLQHASSFLSFLGIIISSRLIWLYIYPNDTINCFLPIEKIIDHHIPFRALVKLIINGVGICQSPKSILPIVFAIWSLVVFIIAAIIAIRASSTSKGKNKS